MKILELATAISLGIPSSTLAQTTTPMHEVAGVPLVQVSVNGAGPFPFVLDTGASVTMVKGQLLRALNISATESVAVAASLGESHDRRSQPGSLAIEGLSVDNVDILMLEDGQLGVLEGKAQGVLGENFLKHFDVLIDNERHTLTLDRTSMLAQSLAGERLALSSAGRATAEIAQDMLLVPLKAPSLFGRPMLFLVDSGSNTAMMYSPQNEMMPFSRGSGAHGTIGSLNGNHICQVARTSLTIGSQIYREVGMAICQDRMRNHLGNDGLLPTRLFRRLFISHRDKYVIANPRADSKEKNSRAQPPQTIAGNVGSP